MVRLIKRSTYEALGPVERIFADRYIREGRWKMIENSNGNQVIHKTEA